MTVQQLAGVAEFSVVADPRRARHVVGLRLPEDTREPRPALLALHHGLRRLQGDYGPRSTAPADVAQVIAVRFSAV